MNFGCAQRGMGLQAPCSYMSVNHEEQQSDEGAADELPQALLLIFTIVRATSRRQLSEARAEGF